MRPKRVYVIEYDFLEGVYSASGGKLVNRRDTYFENERDRFIENYQSLLDKYYVENIKCYVAELREVDMGEVINAI